METLSKPASKQSEAASDGGSGQQAAPDSQRARNVAQTGAILGSPVLAPPQRGSGPKPPPKVPALNLAKSVAVSPPALAKQASSPVSAPVKADASVKQVAAVSHDAPPAHDDADAHAVMPVAHDNPDAHAAVAAHVDPHAQSVAPVVSHGAMLGAQVAVPAQSPKRPAAAAHGAAPQGAPQAVIAPSAPDPKLAKMSKGKLARKVLEETDVSGKDASGQDRSSARGQALATAISKGAFQAAADALAGPSFDSQLGFQTAFIAAWKGLNKGYDDQGKRGKDLLEPLLQAKFKGNKFDYLMDLRMFGQSSAEFAVLLCLGEIEGGSPHEDAVVRAFERAAETLDNAKFQAMWAKVKGPLQKKMKHTFASDARLHRVLAAKDLKEAEAPVAAAEAVVKTKKDEELAAHTKEQTTDAALTQSKAELAPKVDDRKAKAGTFQKATLDETAATEGVASETAAVAKHKADAAQADKDFAKAENQFILDTQALQAANQAHQQALQAVEAANRALALQQQHKAAPASASASAPASTPAATPAAKSAEGEGKDPLEEAIAIARQTRLAELRAQAAVQTVAKAKAEINKLQLQVTKSKGTYAAAWASQQDAHDSVAEHEKELRARQDKLEQAHQTLEAARLSAEAAKAEAEKAQKAVDALEAQLKLDKKKLKEAKEGVEDAENVVAQKKAAQLAGGTEVKYLATLVESLKDKLNDFDREAIEELQKWAKAHGQARGAAVAPGSLFLAALDEHVKKDRNKKLFIALIKGEKEEEIKDKLVGTGQPNTGSGFTHKDTEETLDDVTMTELVVERESQKHSEKKLQIRTGPAKIEHTILKQQVMSMSPEAREQYLAVSTGASKADLQDATKRNAALAQLDDRLKDKCGIVDAKERERMLALFKVAGAGVNYSKLYGLVHTTEPKKYATDNGFAEKALSYITEFGDGEFHQLRQDKEVLDAVKVCKKKVEINNLVGGIDVATKAIAPLTDSKADGDKAKTDALHESAHWSTLIGLEMDKWKATRNRNDVYLFSYRAQQAALEVAKVKDPQHKDAVTDTHPEAQKFVQAVWAGISADNQGHMKGQYGDVAAALQAGHGITLDMVLGSIAKFHIGSMKLYVDKADIKKTFDATKGKELLEQWSNIEEFTEQKKTVAGDPAKERELKRSFVLDIKAEKRTWLDDAVGGDSLKLANALRDRFKHAAEHDGEFKDGLKAAGYDNTQFNREKIEFRGLLEKASKQRKGWDVGGFSSKGHAQHQAHREMVGGLRSANKDDEEINAKKDGTNDHAVDHERDHNFEHEHAKGLDEKKEELELSGEEFDKLRENIRKYTEIAIGIIISVAITAATMGTVPAWAMVLVKVGAVIMADIVKEVVGNAITGDKMNARKLVTNIVADSVGAAAGGFAGSASIANAGEMNEFLKEFIKGTVTSVTKSAGKDGIKAMAQRNSGEVTVSGAIKNQIIGFIVSAAASQLAATASHELGHKAEEDAKDREGKIEPDKQSLEHLNGDAKPEATAGVAEHTHGVAEAQSTVNDAQGVVHGDEATIDADHAHVDADTAHLQTASAQVDAARQHLHEVQQHYHGAMHGSARTELAQARANLAAAKLNLTNAHHALSADQAKLDGDEARLGHDEATLDADKEALETANKELEAANTHLEDINKQIEAIEARIKPDEDAIAADEAVVEHAENVGKIVDYTADKVLDPPADIIKEKVEERREHKLEAVTPKPKKG